MRRLEEHLTHDQEIEGSNPSHHVLLPRDPAGPRDGEPLSHADSRATRERSSSLPTIGMRMRALTRGFEPGRTGDLTVRPGGGRFSMPIGWSTPARVVRRLECLSTRPRPLPGALIRAHRHPLIPADRQVIQRPGPGRCKFIHGGTSLILIPSTGDSASEGRQPLR